jgi:outer membrane protein assembly factor BamB
MVYVVDIKTGNTIWSTSSSKLNVGTINRVYVEDFNKNNKPEVMVLSTERIMILDGQDGKLIKESKMKFNSDQTNFNIFLSDR